MLNTKDESRVKIAKVDCTEHQKTCSDQSVTSYPSLLFFKQSSDGEPIKYRSTRDLPSLTQFINDQLGSSTPEEEEEETEVDSVVPAPLKGLIELTDNNFASATAVGNWLVKFYGKIIHAPNNLTFHTTQLFYSTVVWPLPEACPNF